MYVDFSFVEFIFPCLITLQQEIEVLLNNGKLIAKNYKGVPRQVKSLVGKVK